MDTRYHRTFKPDNIDDLFIYIYVYIWRVLACGPHVTAGHGRDDVAAVAGLLLRDELGRRGEVVL